MRIAEFQIEGFGRFANLSLSDVPPGLSIVVGQNEAGKTTLLEFLRSILFGLPSRKQKEFYPPLHGGRKGGRIVLRNERSERIIVERFEGKGNGPLTVTMPDGSLGGEAEFRALTGSATDDLYRSVFAFSLSELQTFESLNTEKVRDAIYSAGIGMGRRTITQIVSELKKQADDLFVPGGSKPVMNQLLSRLTDYGQQIKGHEKDLDEYDRIRSELAAGELDLQRVGADLNDARRRTERLRILRQAWDDWIELGACREQIETLPAIDSFPIDGMKRLDQLSTERRAIRDQMDQIVSESGSAEASLAAIRIDPAVLGAASEIRRLDRGLEVYEQTERQALSTETERELAAQQLACALRDLGEGWNESQVEEFDLSVPMRQRLEVCGQACVAAREAARVCEARWNDALQEQDDQIRVEEEARSQVMRLPKPSAELDLSGIRKLQLGWERYASARNDLPSVVKPCETRTSHLLDTLRKIGPNWTEDRLRGFDTSLVIQEDVSAYQQRLGELRSDQQEAERQVQEARQALADAQSDLDRVDEVLAAMPASETTDETELAERRRGLRVLRDQLATCAQRTTRLSHFAERKQDLDAQAVRLQKQLDRESFGVPIWAVLVVLAVGAVGLFGLGIGRGDWAAGGIVFGVAAIVALALGIARRTSAARGKQHREEQAQDVRNLQERSGELQRAAQEVQQELEESRSLMLTQARSAGFDTIPDAAMLDNAEGIVEHSLAAHERRRPAEQKRDDAQRTLAKAQAAVARADESCLEKANLLDAGQQEWRQWLANQDLPASLTAEVAATVLNRLDAAREQLKAIESDRDRITQMKTATQSYAQLVKTVASASGFETGVPEDTEAAVHFLDSRREEYEKRLNAADDAASGLAEAEKKTVQAKVKTDRILHSHQQALDEELKCQERWRELLKRLGISESLAVESIPQMLQAIERAQSQLVRLRDLQRRQGILHESRESFCHDVRAVLQATGCAADVEASIPDSLSSLARELEKIEQGHRRAETLKEGIQNLETRATALERQIDQREQEISHLLKAALTADEETFRRNAADYETRQALAQQIRSIETRLWQLAGSREALQAVKDELSAANPESLDAEQKALDEAIKTKETQHTDAADRRGRLKEQLERLENSEELSLLRIAQQADCAEFGANAEEWSVLRIAAHLIDMAREKYERERRPGVLKEAERYFARFTNGNYTEILAPAGGDQIVVLARDGSRKEIGQLSRGTAEQLYLSLRFGFVQEFIARSEPLPLVFDDILVNFDCNRARSAVEAVLELSKSLQILLFTCHASTVELVREVEPSISVFVLKDSRLANFDELTSMREEGLEPTHLSVPDPKSGASANSATLASLTNTADFNRQ